MNLGAAENEFQVGLGRLLEAVERELAPEVLSPYQRSGSHVVHEHDTRKYFFDRFLALLGWHLGPGGDVAEEVRIKGETTTFMDYAAVNANTRAPALLVEAKSWEKPFVRPRGGKRPNATERELIIEAVLHVRSGGEKTRSPVSGDWHDYLVQVAGYVRQLKERYGHELPRVMLGSGQWLLVFTSPVVTFIDGNINDEQFKIFKLAEYVGAAANIYKLLSQPKLAAIAPVRLRSTQLLDHVTAATVTAVYHALLIRYENSGATLFAPQPRILVYPALLVQRNDGTLFTIIDREQPIYMNLESSGDSEVQNINSHLEEIAAWSTKLLRACSNEIGMPLVTFDLSDFPGFPDSEDDATLPLGGKHKAVVRRLKRVGDEWVLATGTYPHYVLAEPSVACRFHAWGECKVEESQIGQQAISTPRTDYPRSFFVDGSIYHCSHQAVQDRRDSRCHIAAIDMRTCCRACVYQNLCWTPVEITQLPCGS